MNRSIKLALAGFSALGLAALAVPASAKPVVTWTLTDDHTSATLSSGMDTSLTSNFFAFDGIGSGIHLTISDNSPGVATVSNLQNTFLEVNNTTGDKLTLDLWVSDTAYVRPKGSVKLASQIGGTETAPVDPAIVDDVSYFSCAGNNTANDCSQGTTSTLTHNGLTTHSGPQGLGSWSDANALLISNLAAPYDLSEHSSINIYTDASFTLNEATLVTPVPEPASLLILGAALLGFAGMLGFRRRHDAV